MSDVEDVDALATLTGSTTRADVLEALFAAPARIWRPTELARAAGAARQTATRELEWLSTTGIVTPTLLGGARAYRVDVTDPATRELGRYVQQTRGRVPRIRKALAALRSPTLAWTTSVSGPTDGPEPLIRDGPVARRGETLQLVVLTGAPRSLVLVQLADIKGNDMGVLSLSLREWLTRLQKGDVALRRYRRARKLWVLGSWSELVRREEAELRRRSLLASALEDWREELSDEWDEEWDPLGTAESDGPSTRWALGQ